jgi:hypothetical protein
LKRDALAPDDYRSELLKCLVKSIYIDILQSKFPAGRNPGLILGVDKLRPISPGKL